ncbi:hypothetical protein ABT340_04730 [Streptosporangium sp. NPDC000239]|uniref:hypothetical protein n=1 Tax=Streptosporangium sp. NPDC000239 TaxID=3154248 RepID=UPI00332254F8
MTSHGRWADDPQPTNVDSPPTYSAEAVGAVRRAPLHDHDGQLLGHVWTDDLAAAGFQPAEQAGPAGVQAGAYVWTVLSECHRRDIPAAELLDPILYSPAYGLRP